MMKVTVAGVNFDGLTMVQAVAQVVEMARAGDKFRHVCTCNTDHLALMREDAAFREVYADADLVLADGAPIVWLSRLCSCRPNPALPERVTGSDLLWELARASADQGLRLFLLGGMPGAADRAAEALIARYPGARICGTYCPPRERFASEEEQARICDRIQRARPDVLLVGFGTPKQEKWIADRRGELGVPVSIGVGAGLDMAGGLVRRAPLWMRRTGLEWFFRFLKEPRRLAGRYFGRDLPFLGRLTVHAAAVRMRTVWHPVAAADADP